MILCNTMYLSLDFSWHSSTWLQCKEYFKEQRFTSNGTCTLQYLLEYSPWVVLNPTQSWSFRFWFLLSVVSLTSKNTNQHYNRSGNCGLKCGFWIQKDHHHLLNYLTVDRCTNRKRFTIIKGHFTLSLGDVTKRKNYYKPSLKNWVAVTQSKKQRLEAKKPYHF